MFGKKTDKNLEADISDLVTVVTGQQGQINALAAQNMALSLLLSKVMAGLAVSNGADLCASLIDNPERFKNIVLGYNHNMDDPDAAIDSGAIVLEDALAFMEEMRAIMDDS